MARSARHGRREGIHRRSSLGKDSPRVQWEVGPQKNGAGENVTQKFGRIDRKRKAKASQGSDFAGGTHLESAELCDDVGVQGL